jgi:hypothetical protein
VFARVKILVSFVTIMLTVDQQFGVIWPQVDAEVQKKWNTSVYLNHFFACMLLVLHLKPNQAFQKALAALSVISFDFGVFTSVLCLVNLSFYTSFFCTTLLLVVILGTIYAIHTLLQRQHQQTPVHPPDHPETIAKAAKIRQSCMFVAIYLLTFAYPIVLVKVVELFGCHFVDGVVYLRADYSIECYTSEWNAMAAYASLFLALYVIGFPIFVATTLWSYHHLLKKHGPGHRCANLRLQGCSLASSWMITS